MNSSDHKRLLVCAHDSRLIGNLQKALASLPVNIATSGGECLSMIDCLQPEVLLVQMFLSDMDAFDLLTKINERCSCSPKVVLFTSAHPGAAAQQFAALRIAGTILTSEPLDSLHKQLQPYFENQLPPLMTSGSAIYIASGMAKSEQYRRVFENNNIQCQPAEMPEMAADLIQQFQPSFVLFEIEACLGHIFPVIRAARSLKTPAGLIAVSQLEDARLENRILESGAHCILNVPVSDEELCEAIHSVNSLRKSDCSAMKKSNRSILVVEDAPESARTLELLLREHGYGVTIVETAEAAMKLLPNKIFNLILLDLLLPGMSGVELLARVRHSGSRIPCVVVTGSHDQKDRRLLEDLGVQAIFDKPANYEIVTDLIGELIST